MAEPERAVPDRQEAVANDSARDAEAEAGQPAAVQMLLDLQATAGNRAVVQLLGKDADLAMSDVPPGTAALHSGAWQFGRHPEFPGVMGQTWYAHNDIGQWPSFSLEYSRSFWPPFRHQARPRPTDAIGAAWPVLATAENDEGYRMPGEHPQHPGKEYDIRVGGNAANAIAGAEAQHVNDLDEGWDLTGRSAKLAINKAAAEDWSEGSTRAAAKEAAIDKVASYMGALGPKVRSALESGGSLEPALGPMMDASFTQSKAMRDASGKHTIPVVYVGSSADDTKVLYEVDPDHALDTTPTASVVNLGTIGG